MPHQRIRHSISLLKKYASFSPSVGVVGLRQVGKTTLLTKQLGITNTYSLDELALRTEANRSPTTFLAKLDLPCVIDEIQKAPNIFDAIKLRIDKNRIPGQYFATGSTAFSSKAGIRESLTGRMAVMQLFPFTLAEAHQLPFDEKRIQKPLHTNPPRVRIESATEMLTKGGLPVAMFMRDADTRRMYFEQYLDASILRDLPKLFGRNYDPDTTRNILTTIGKILAEGETPTYRHFQLETRVLKRYLEALESIFILRRIPCHNLGSGLDHWIVGDTGLVTNLMGTTLGEGATLSLARHLVFNEIQAGLQYSGKSIYLNYYKSSQAKENIDFIIDGIPAKIIHSPPASLPIGWYEKPLLGAMKKLQSKVGLLVAPVDHVDIPKTGIGIVPWTHWS